MIESSEIFYTLKVAFRIYLSNLTSHIILLNYKGALDFISLHRLLEILIS